MNIMRFNAKSNSILVVVVDAGVFGIVLLFLDFPLNCRSLG